MLVKRNTMIQNYSKQHHFDVFVLGVARNEVKPKLWTIKINIGQLVTICN
jgi:hypothetical protein